MKQVSVYSVVKKDIVVPNASEYYSYSIPPTHTLKYAENSDDVIHVSIEEQRNKIYKVNEWYGNQRTESFLSVDKDLKQALCAIVRDEVCDDYETKISSLKIEISKKDKAIQESQKEYLKIYSDLQYEKQLNGCFLLMPFWQRLMFLLFNKFPDSLKGK